MIKEAKVKVIGVPIPNALWYLALNTSRPPFDNVKLRQAVAWAMPYEQIQANAFFGRAKPMYGAASDAVEQAVWPQPFPYRTDLDKAKALMAEAGLGSGLDTTVSLDVGTATVGEPAAVLIQESLGKIGIRVSVEKIPGANWRTTLNKKELPMVLNRFSGWLDYPEYYFFWNLHGSNSIFNISAYRNPAMDALIERARFTEDRAEYEQSVKAFIALCMQEVPIVPLNQPIHDVAMQKAVGGYEFWFHREPDFRQYFKG
jgi:peptide/nickel transport system substrate-binding protein